MSTNVVEADLRCLIPALATIVDCPTGELCVSVQTKHLLSGGYATKVLFDDDGLASLEPIPVTIVPFEEATTCRTGVSTMVQHLNDHHRWTREAIADWLETLDIDLSFPSEKPTDLPSTRPKPPPRPSPPLINWGNKTLYEQIQDYLVANKGPFTINPGTLSLDLNAEINKITHGMLDAKLALELMAEWLKKPIKKTGETE